MKIVILIARLLLGASLSPIFVNSVHVGHIRKLRLTILSDGYAQNILAVRTRVFLSITSGFVPGV